MLVGVMRHFGLPLLLRILQRYIHIFFVQTDSNIVELVSSSPLLLVSWEPPNMDVRFINETHGSWILGVFKVIFFSF